VHPPLSRSRRASAAGRRLAIFALAALAAMGHPAGAEAATKSLAAGRKLFRQYCIPCHGETGGGGGMGPSIVGEKSLELENRDIFQTIRRGRAELGMPAFGSGIAPQQIAKLVSYVRALQGVEVEGAEEMEWTPAARPKAELERIARGRDLFAGRARCSECHSIFDDGGMVAPDLTEIGKRMSWRQIRNAIVNPSDEIAPDYRAKEIVTKAGSTILGWYREETPDTIQLFDPDEDLWTTYFKRDLQSIRDATESLMPSDLLDPLNETEQRALMTFLTSLD